VRFFDEQSSGIAYFLQQPQATAAPQRYRELFDPLEARGIQSNLVFGLEASSRDGVSELDPAFRPRGCTNLDAGSMKKPMGLYESTSSASKGAWRSCTSLPLDSACALAAERRF
jgi:hypothetical protein